MSNMVIKKLHVDVLVHAALYGPMGAASWEPLTKDPDELGRDLMSTSRRKSGERSGDGYVFTPLPIALTAIEIIKACEFFTYNRSKSAAIIKRIRDESTSYLDGWHEAPWAWKTADIDARQERPGPGSDLPAEPSAELVAVTERLSGAGLQHLKASSTIPEDIDEQVRGRDQFYGSVGGAVSSKFSGGTFVTPISVLVAKSDEIAATAFPALVSRVVWGNSLHNEIRRLGNLLVTAAVRDPSEETLVGSFLDRLGSSDERWTSVETPLHSGSGEVVSSSVVMRLHTSALATTPAELEVLLQALPDPALRDKLRDVDLRAQAILAAPGLETVRVQSVDLVRSTQTLDKGRHVMAEDMVLTYIGPYGAPQNVGSVIVVPKPRKVPNAVRAHTQGTTIPHAQRFGSWVGGLIPLRVRK